MKKTRWIALAALVALAATGIAVAAKDKGISTASASFDTSKGAQTKTRTCTGADGTYELTHGVYTGTGTGLLAGNVQLRFNSIVNTTEHLGLFKGTLTAREGNDLKVKAKLTAVLDGSNVSGFLNGRAKDAKAALLANFSATLGSNSLDGQLGGGSASNTAVLYAGTGCTKTTVQKAAAAAASDKGNGKGKKKGKGHRP
jgi:hypothetical protein